MKAITKVLIITISFFLTSYTSQAQQSDVGVEIKEHIQDWDNHHEMLGIIGEDQSGYYALRLDKNAVTSPELSILYYSHDAQLQWVTDLTNINLGRHKNSKGLTYEFGIVDKKENLHIYFSDFKDETNFLYKMRLDKTTRKFLKATTVLKELADHKKLDRRDSYYMTESPDKQLFGILSSIKIKKKEYSSAYLSVFNKSLELQWDQQAQVSEEFCDKFIAHLVNTKIKSFQTIESNIALSNEGIFNIVQHIGGKKTCLKKLACIIYSFHGSNKKWNTRIVNFQDHIIGRFHLKYTDKNELNLVSLIGETEIGIVGTTSNIYNAFSLDEISATTNLLSEKQRVNFVLAESDDRSNKSIANIPHYTRIDEGKPVKIPFNNVILQTQTHSDNSYTLFGESIDYTFTDDDVSFTHRDYFFVHIDSQGKIQWVKNIPHLVSGPKDHTTTGSFCANDKIYWIYSQKKESGRKNMISSMDKSGNFKVSSITPKNEQRKMFSYKLNGPTFNQISDSAFLFTSQKENNLKTTKVVFQ